MLKIKEEKWVEFMLSAADWGFEKNDIGNAYVRRFYEEKIFPKDYIELQVWTDSRQVSLETSNVRYSGFATDGEELEVLYDLMMEGLVEKVNE